MGWGGVYGGLSARSQGSMRPWCRACRRAGGGVRASEDPAGPAGKQVKWPGSRGVPVRMELPIRGTRTVPASCQRDRGVWGSIGVRPTGICVSKGETTAGWLLEGPGESWPAVHAHTLVCVCE